MIDDIVDVVPEVVDDLLVEDLVVDLTEQLRVLDGGALQSVPPEVTVEIRLRY